MPHPPWCAQSLLCLYTMQTVSYTALMALRQQLLMVICLLARCLKCWMSHGTFQSICDVVAYVLSELVSRSVMFATHSLPSQWCVTYFLPQLWDCLRCRTGPAATFNTHPAGSGPHMITPFYSQSMSNVMKQGPHRPQPSQVIHCSCLLPAMRFPATGLLTVCER